jgi:sugar diacid utilization regulator
VAIAAPTKPNMLRENSATVSPMHAAERLARLIDRARPPRPAEARAVRAELLGALLGWRAAGNRRQHAHRAATLGLGVEAPLQVTVARVAAPDSLALAERLQLVARAQAELEMRLTAAIVPFLLGTNNTDLVMVAPDDAADVFRTTLAELAQTGAPFRAGIGRGVPTLDELPRSYLDARFAVEQLGDSDEVPTTTAILAYDELDFATSLLCDADPEMLQARRSVLKDMALDTALRETLLAYLANQLDVRRTASALHLHPNSLRYRLARIEERLGRPLADPATITDLYLATRVDRANGSR